MIQRIFSWEGPNGNQINPTYSKKMTKKHGPQRSWVPDLVSTQVKGMERAECPRNSSEPRSPYLAGSCLNRGADVKDTGTTVPA